MDRDVRRAVRTVAVPDRIAPFEYPQPPCPFHSAPAWATLVCWFSVKWNWQGRRVCEPREAIVAIPRLRVPLPCYVTPG